MILQNKMFFFIIFDYSCGRLKTRFIVKEVIQPQVPLRLPCYDFTPVADYTVVKGLKPCLKVEPTPMV